MTTPIERLNGIDLYCESHGEGPAVVFLHGAGGNHISWWQQIPTFRERYRCVTIDHRGFGASTDPEREGAARFVDDLGALLDRLDVERAGLVAQSMGGLTALGFTVRHPDRVSALAMCDTWGFFDWPELREQQQQLWEARPGGEPAAGLVQREGMPEHFQRARPAMAFLYGQVQELNPLREQTAANAAGGGMTKDDVAALRVPALFVVGADDALTPPQIIYRVHELIAGSEYVELEGCGHSVYWESRGEFNETVAAFLAKHVLEDRP